MKTLLIFKLEKSALLLMALIALNSCNSSTNHPVEPEANNELTEEIVIEDVWLIEEHEINDIALTSKSPNAKDTPLEKKSSNSIKNGVVKSRTQEAVEAEELNEEAYEIATLAIFSDMVAEEEYIAENTYQVDEAIIPLDETQTIVSFNKKGKAEDAFQVVTNSQTDEIEQIIFTDKKHTDEYNVSVGISGKEVKKLRRELKHMVHKGQVFLYDDTSNIMYLMDAENMVGKEISAEEIDAMEVSAIIWKDKKHHKKMK